MAGSVRMFFPQLSWFDRLSLWHTPLWRLAIAFFVAPIIELAYYGIAYLIASFSFKLVMTFLGKQFTQLTALLVGLTHGIVWSFLTTLIVYHLDIRGSIGTVLCIYGFVGLVYGWLYHGASRAYKE
ncbi:hypothetical protein [Hymenobacter sp. GOD-10R]|uniref:hypothetical protein n=1 Tax=Hymenobacter sp. GOD-10R TaxID=3093922 RepID=UPI002D7A2B75|nr:hypothetical protein [Hymenobacter sp. GOD-10R]WRQ26614.1 hypothetical protein SD425_16195 [Hymenobacter sp. GOD-10R]